MAWVLWACCSTAAAQPAETLGASQTYTREEIERAGFVTLADFLQRQPWAGASISPRFNSGGDGEQRVEIGDLGDSRTQLRVDGRRWIATLDGGFDLSAIPLASVERVTVQRGGYGVAGSIDIVLRPASAGLEASSWLGEFDSGDGRTQAHGARLGAATERASAALDVSYLKQEPILAGDRAVSSVPAFGLDANDVRQGASSTTPFGRFGRAGVPGTVTLIPGRSGSAASDFRPFVEATDGYNFAPESFLLTPTERTAVHGRADFALTDALDFHTRALASERRSQQRLAPIQLLAGSIFGPSVPPTISAANVFNPFGVPVTRAQFRQTQLARTFDQDVDTYAFEGGFDGRFDAFERGFAWSLGYRYADVERRDSNRGKFDQSRLSLGLGPSYRDAGGVARCGTALQPIAGCVPINWFGGPAGFTREMLDYTSVIEQSSQRAEQVQYYGGFSGTLIDLPAGPLAFRFDAEHRRESGAVVPDALSASGGSTASGGIDERPWTGQFALDSVGVAVDVPLLREVVGAQLLDLRLSVESVDDSDSGRDSAPRIELAWVPIDRVAFRAHWAEALRHASLRERFEPEVQSFLSGADVCEPGQIWRQSPVVTRRCAEGFGGIAPYPPGGYAQDSSLVAQLGGGAAYGLRPERAIQRGLGITIDAWPIEGLRVDLDWQQLQIDDPIGVRTGRDVLQACYVAGLVDSCRFIRRNASGDIVRLFIGSQNAPISLEQESYDLALQYPIDTRFGRFDLRWQTSYLSYLGERGQPDRGALLADASIAQGNRVGVLLGDAVFAPRLRSSATLDWQHKDWSATLGVRYRSALDESCGVVVSILSAVGQPQRAAQLCSQASGTPRFPAGANRIAAYAVADGQLRWKTPWDGHVSLGVHNLLDRDPPVSFASGNRNLLVSDELPGRFWYLAYAQRF